MKNSSCVIIPAYNEEASLGLVLSALRSIGNARDIIVVDDGSTDRTCAIAKGFGVRLLRLSAHLGRDAAIQSGFIYAVNKEYDKYILMDADGQHDPNFIPQFIAHKQAPDMLIGNRYAKSMNYRGSSMRRFASLILSCLILFRSGRWISDPTSGFRVFSKRATRYLAASYPRGFPEPETILLFLGKSWRVVEMPVQMHARQGGTSSVTLFRGIAFMVTFIWRVFRYY